MKKIRPYLTFALIALALSWRQESPAQQKKNTGTNKTWYPSGKLQSEMFYDSTGVLIRTVSYYESGARKHDCSYYGQLEGPNIYYFEHGKVMVFFLYKNGVPDGRAYANYENNHLAYEQFFKDGYKTGVWKYFNEDGTLREEDHFEGFEDNKTRAYDNRDFADKKYFYSNTLAYTVAVRNGEGTDTMIHDTAAFAALRSEEAPPTGKSLFQSFCAPCHHPVKDAAGPMMKGVTKKRSRDWLAGMIVNGDELVKSGDADAVALFEKWNRMPHPDFTHDLDDEKVSLIVGYLKTIK